LNWGSNHPTPEKMDFKVHQLPVIQLPKLPIFYNLKRMGFGYTPNNVTRLTQIAERFKPDIIHLVNHIFDTSFLTVHVSRKLGIPLVASITTPVQHQNHWKQMVMGTADRIILGGLGARHFDGIVSLDQVVHHYVGLVYGKRIQQRSRIIPFGVRIDSEQLYNNQKRTLSSKPQILMVGHIHPFRNPVQLVRAMPYVLEKFPNAQLFFIGRVDLKEPSKAAQKLNLGDSIRFIGELSSLRTIEMMKRSHVFVSWATGPYPGLGTAPMEAMLCGTPVINDLPEDLFGPNKLKNGENIVLVDSKDAQQIGMAIVKLLSDEKYSKRIGEGGRKFVKDHLSWSDIAMQMDKFYNDIIVAKSN
jgi:glycosyltransferase involved in cell wall biosynthesis